MKRRHPIHVERYVGEIARLAVQQRDNSVDRTLHFGWGRGLTRGRESMEHPCTGLRLARLGKLDATDPSFAPRDAAAPDRGIEEGKAMCCHVEIVSPARTATLGESCSR